MRKKLNSVSLHAAKERLIQEPPRSVGSKRLPPALRTQLLCWLHSERLCSNKRAVTLGRHSEPELRRLGPGLRRVKLRHISGQVCLAHTPELDHGILRTFVPLCYLWGTPRTQGSHAECQPACGGFGGWLMFFKGQIFAGM